MLDTIVSLDDIILIDTLYRSADQKNGDPNMVDLIGQQTNLFVKNYGPSSIATISLRGSNASQVGVEWNGVSIANPMLGLTDLGIMHSFMIDRVTINTDDLNPTSLAGTVELTSLPGIVGNFEIYNAFGSFGLREHGLKGRYKYKNLSGEVRLLSTTAQNNFDYLLTNGEKLTTSNAALASNNIQLILDYNIDEKSSINLSSWMSNYRREIPKLTTQRASEAFQLDNNWWTALAYKRMGGILDLELNIGLTNGVIDYRDPAISLVAKTDFKTASFIGKVSRSHWYGRSQLRIRNERTQSFADAYGGRKNRNIAAVTIQETILFPFIRLDGNLGFKNINFKTFYPSYGLTLLKKVGGSFLVKGSYKRSVRVPTTNDLYWSNGGNVDLKPEVGDEFILGGHLLSKHWELRLDVYHRDTKDWILWARASGFQSFAVFNIANVLSYGVEAKVGYSTPISGRQSIRIGSLVSLGRSQNQKEVSLPKINKGDQLLYTPTHSVKSSFQYKFKRLSFEVNHQLYSSMKGINQDVDGYHIANLEAAYRFKINKLEFVSVIGAYNAFNENYRIIEFRPMSGRNYKFTLNLKF